jgi:hypothetical protein
MVCGMDWALGRKPRRITLKRARNLSTAWVFSTVKRVPPNTRIADAVSQ